MYFTQYIYAIHSYICFKESNSFSQIIPIAGDADPTISTSTPTPCYGDEVTLVCHHPEVASNPGRYFSQPTAWEENGIGITPSTGVYSTADTSEDLTRTTLTITIIVDHFRNKSFNYSCLLLLAANGRPSSEVETSENVTVDPVGEWIYNINSRTRLVRTWDSTYSRLNRTIFK